MSKRKIVGCILICCMLVMAVVISVKSKERTIKKKNEITNEDIYALDLQEGQVDEITAVSEADEIDEGEPEVSTTDASNWDLNKVNIVYDTEGVAVPVPKGYVASGADGEHTVNTGFVIYEGDGEVTTENAWNESCTRNQWVWVPVPDSSRIYETDANGKKKSKLYSYTSTGRTSYTNSNYEPGILTSYDNEKYFARYQMQGMMRNKLLNELQEELDETIESIEKYGGFWIGRYETGALSVKELVVQRMNTDIGSQTWYTEYTRMQLMGANANVKTNMIFGCLWDETLQWLVDTENKTYAEIVDSTSWGNYKPMIFEYTTTSGVTGTKMASSSTRVPTGSAEYTKANNIYDMAGNVSEGILEGNGFGSRRLCGGNYDDRTISDMGASYRSHGYPSGGYNGCGFRAYLYIK